jgi:Ser/Thr protein kinase RdoA (MazF antagonist)
VAKGPRTVLPIPDGTPEPLEGGYKNTLLRYGDLVLRLEKADLDSVQWEHGVLRFLVQHMPEVVVPVAGPAVLEDGRIGSLLPFVEGADLDPDDRHQRLELARVLARLHLAGLDWQGGPRPGRPAFVDLDWKTNHWWDWTIVEKRPALVQAYEEATAWLAAAPPLGRGIVHGDICRANVRVRNRSIVGVLDWEEARVDWPAWELANATWEVCRAGEALDAGRANDFIQAYVDAGGPGETEPFTPLLRVRLIADALYSLTRAAEGGAWDPPHVERLLKALAGLQ